MHGHLELRHGQSRDAGMVGEWSNGETAGWNYANQWASMACVELGKRTDLIYKRHCRPPSLPMLAEVASPLFLSVMTILLLPTCPSKGVVLPESHGFRPALRSRSLLSVISHIFHSPATMSDALFADLLPIAGTDLAIACSLT